MVAERKVEAREKAAPTIEWVRPPVQDRSQRTLLRLLEASAALLEERSFEAIGVTDIVRRAESSVGAFYARFQSKDAVLHSLHERYAEESRATAERALDPAAWEGVPLVEVVERFCEFVVRAHEEKGGLRRALLIASAHDPLHRERAVALAAFVTGCVRRLLEERKHELGHPDVAVAADFVHRLVFSVLDQELIFGHAPAGNELSREALVRELTHALVGYLRIGEGAFA